ncbi:uncharacterized protein LOC131649795 [Vicia villosa]|uniref:uncharacterized protein LOC131649795 n=1 Tax=Vicia villosa TaxID=3911 RepID=UPI00273C4870|nr:uncharacterized protein LOC131649795 [Vicia villosa]
MRIEELQSSLEAQELCLTKRTSEREVKQALKASFVKKDQKLKKHGRSQKSEVFYSDEEKHQKGKEKYDKKMVQCYCCNRFGHFAKDCWSNKEEAKIARGDSDDEPVLLMAYESDEEPVKDDFEDSGEDSESEVSEDESELEDDSEAEDKSESEGDSESEGESEDDSESEEDFAYEDKSELESSEGESDSEDFDDDQESGGGHASGRESSEDIGFGGQASKYDHVSGVNHDVEGGTSEGGASEGSPASDGGHDSERKDYEVGTSKGRASEGDPTSKGGGFEQDPEVNKGGTSGGSQTFEENPEGDIVPESEGDSELLAQHPGHLTLPPQMP